MKVFDANISSEVLSFLKKKLKKTDSLKAANQQMSLESGIKNFFEDVDEFKTLKRIIGSEQIVEEPDRTEYGDFQTNSHLANSVVLFLKECHVNPQFVIEPTCGQGNFILASLQLFEQLEKIVGVEIYKPYVWETKFNVLKFFIDNPTVRRPEIEIYHFNVFDFDFEKIALEITNRELLVIGNPPWVTNSKLGELKSKNLPTKSNFKNHSGFDAITGKGNFDIGEYITLMMFNTFENLRGHFAFLVKNSVVKNVVHDQRQRNYKISDLKRLSIDSKREFGVSVEASLFFCKFGLRGELTCDEFGFYNSSATATNTFGWIEEKFVSDITRYKHSQDIDGISPFEWRQGIKHDLSSIMELERFNGHFINGFKQEVNIENELVYGLLKSSDLKLPVIDETRKFTIVTQRKVGQDTSFIRSCLPLTYIYLNGNKTLFSARKSSIYINKPDFSIFGIGDYSFAPYKVAISGLYKNYSFNLILPQKGKPIMLDDTCYLLGFNDLDFAVYTFILLNSPSATELLRSITFLDAKRTFTKDILMRLDLAKIAMTISSVDLKKELSNLKRNFGLNIGFGKWDEYLLTMKPIQKAQLDIFI